MPCRDDYPPDPKDTVAYVKAMLEPLLCEACGLLEEHALFDKASKELRAWAIDHEKQEQDRVRREALAKLTPKERRALGFT